MQPASQPLNTVDCFELRVHDMFRAFGHPGLKLQLHLHLAGRLEERVLVRAVERLERRHPVATARLDRHALAWKPVSRGGGRVAVQPLGGESDRAVWDAAASLLSRPIDPVEDPPLAFTLMRRASGRDVLVVEWTHALMDGKAGELLLRELNRVDANPQEADDPVPPLTEDEILQRIRSVPLRERWWAIRSQLRHPRDEVLMPAPPHGSDGWTSGSIRLSGRTLDVDTTAGLIERASELCGFANLIPLLTSSAFRALAQTVAPSPSAHLRAPVPFNLRPPGARGPLFRNLMSYVNLRASVAELADRDRLTRTLHQRMRQEFVDRADLVTLIGMRRAARSRLARRRAMRRPLRISLGLAHMGEMPADLATFCGVPVTGQYYLTTLPSPPGLGVSFGICGKRLHVSMTHVEPTVPAERAERFLDTLLDDLTVGTARTRPTMVAQS